MGNNNIYKKQYGQYEMIQINVIKTISLNK